MHVSQGQEWPDLASKRYRCDHVAAVREHVQHARQRDGRERAIADGSFDRLFNEYHGERLCKARLDQRIVIELGDPMLIPGARTERAELCYRHRPEPAQPR